MVVAARRATETERPLVSREDAFVILKELEVERLWPGLMVSLSKSSNVEIRRRVAAHPDTPEETRSRLLKTDLEKSVRDAAAEAFDLMRHGGHEALVAKFVHENKPDNKVTLIRL
jgi:hypothetical protein